MRLSVRWQKPCGWYPQSVFQQLRDRAEKRSAPSICSGGQWLISRGSGTDASVPGRRKDSSPGSCFHHSGSGNGGRLHHCPDPLPGKGGWSPERSRLWTVGKKGAVLLSRRGFEISGAPSNGMRPWETADAPRRKLLGAYRAGEIGEIHLFLPVWQGMGLEQKSIRLLPLEKSKSVRRRNRP